MNRRLQRLVRARQRVNTSQIAARTFYNDTSYAGASLTRKQLHNWQPARAPADADLLPDLGMLVARSRDLSRNNGIAAGSIQTLQDNIPGSGLRLSSMPDWRALGKDIKWAEEWTRNVEALWATYSESCYLDVADRMNFASMTQLVFRNWLENGEAVVLALWMPRDTTPYKTCFQLIEADRLTNPQFSMPTLHMRGGIELDDYGKPVAYWIQKASEWLGWYMPFWESALAWERIPAKTDWGRPRILHIYQKDRVDQTRGIPILAPVIEQFRMLDSYQRTELQSAIVNSLVAGVIETPMDAQGIADMMGGEPGQYLDKKNEYRVNLEGGTLIPLWPGDKLTPYTPNRPPGTFPSFVETVIRQIGDALGLPYELIAKDFSKVTFASARASLAEAWRFFENRRRWLAEYWATPVYSMWLEEAINQGDVEAPDFYENRAYYTRCKWIGPGRSEIDPLKEAQASAERLANKTTTLEIECAEAGLDWNEVLEQLALEKERLDQLGLTPPPPPLATAPGKPGQPGKPDPNQPDPSQQDPAQEAA